MSQQPALFRFFCSFLISLLFLTAPVWKDTANAATCTPKIVWKADEYIPNAIEAGAAVTFKWKVLNSSSCPATDLRLAFYSANPTSPTADFGGDKNPSFSLEPWKPGIIEAKMPVAPKEVGTYFELKFDILKSDGTPLNPLALGRLGAEFTIIPVTTPPVPPNCTATLDWTEPKYDAGKLSPSVPTTFLWAVTNTSKNCEAVNYSLVFYGDEPSSPTADHNGTSHPRFNAKPSQTVQVQANILKIPAEEGNYKAYFDIYNHKGDVVPVPDGKEQLYAVFEVSKTVPPPKDPCDSVLAPVVQSVDLVQLGDEGKVLVTANVTNSSGELTVTLDLNGKNYTMTKATSGEYVAVGEGNKAGKNDYTVTAGNGCKFHGLDFVDGVLSSYNMGTCCQDADMSCKNQRKCGRSQFAASKGHPVTTYTGNFAETLTDGAVAGIGDADLFITRSYNSAAALADAASVYRHTQSGREKVAGPPQYFGTGWSSNLDSFLLELNYAPVYEGVQIRFPDGHTQNFEKSGGSYKPSTPDNFDELTKDGNNFVLKRKSSLETWLFGSDGKLRETSDQNGNKVAYTYGGGCLEKISSGSRAVTFTCDAKGHITKAQLPENIVISYEYNDDLLTAMTDGRGNKTQYTYDDNKQLTEITTPLGTPSVQMSYDDRYRVSKQTVGESELYAFVYQGEDAAESTTITDSYGNATVQKHDEKGRQAETIHPDGTTEEFKHDEHNNRTYYKDPAGGEYRYSYDDRGNMLALDGPLGLHKEWSYSQSNLVTATTEKVDDTKNRKFTFEYDAKGNLSKFCLPLQNCGTVTYTAAGLPEKLTDLRGNATIMPKAIS